MAIFDINQASTRASRSLQRWQVLRKAGNDIGAAAEELTLLEAEHAGQQKVVTATRKAAVTAKQPTVRSKS